MIRKLQPIHGPICGVFAATLTTPDMPFCMVQTMAQEEMGKKRWNGPMHLHALLRLLERLQVGFQKVLDCEGRVLRNLVTTLDPAKHYLIFVTGHFLTLKGGRCYDQGNTDGTPADTFWCIGRHVNSVIEITKLAPTYDELFADELE